MKPTYIILLIALFFSQCKVNKKQKPAMEEVIMNEITVSARQQTVSLPYRESEKRVNDLIHTALNLRFDYDKQYVTGKATLTLKPYFYPMDTLTLDAKKFILNKVAKIEQGDTVTLAYEYDEKKIYIKLGRTYKSDETYKIYIDYTARPNEITEEGSAAIHDARGLYFINPKGEEADKPRQIWSQGETQSNSGWFPTIDFPNEKMTQEIALTVDSADVTLSNGELMYSKDNPDGTRTDFWQQSLPHAPYLAMIAIGNFSIIKDYWRDSVEVNYYVEQEYKPYAKLIFGNTPQMLECFSKRTGVDYPWAKFSQIVVRDFVSGAMENTTAVVHFDGLQHDAREHLDQTYESIIAHELFHHWFGDLVTCESWSNVPLNESFATYGEYLWSEYKYGRAEADYHLDEYLDAYLSQKDASNKDLIRYHYRHQDDMFDVVSYQKGGQVLHMLRYYVGDDAFFKSLQLYLTRNKFKPVEIQQLRLAFEEVTGEDLNWFFNQWFLNSGHPVLDINYTFSEDRKKVTIHVEQLQDTIKHGVFRLPMAVDLYTSGNKLRRQVVINRANQDLELTLAEPIELVNVDAEKMLLADVTDNHTPQEWISLFKRGSLYRDKLMAVEGLTESKSLRLTPEINELIVMSSKDTFYGVRELSMEFIEVLDSAEQQTFEPMLVNMAQYDPKSSLRADAISLLGTFKQDKHNKQLFIQALNDSSYIVVGEALRAIAAIDVKRALDFAQQNKDSKNAYLQGATIAGIIGRYGDSTQLSYFTERLGKYGRYKYSLLNSFGRFIARQSDATRKQAVPALKAYYPKADSFSKQMIEDLAKRMNKKYSEAVSKNNEAMKKLKSNDPQRVKLEEENKRSEEMIKLFDSITAAN